MATSTVKMTKRDYFNALLAVEEVKNSTALTDFINHELELLDKRANYKGSGEKKPTARQKENDNFKSAILASMEHGTLYAISDMLKDFDCFGEDMTHNRLTAILTKMVKEASIVRVEEKRKVFYKLAD